jgi:ABC-2 type transport system ATP-binding protein
MLNAKNLTKEFNGTTALNNVNLSVGKREVYCLLGQNGTGKTTTINIFLGFIEASSGEAFINGQEVRTNRTQIATKSKIYAKSQKSYKIL